MFGFPIPIVHWLVGYGIGLISLALLIRVIASWFHMDERLAFIRFLARLTDPFLEPIRRIMPRIGIFDMSYFVTWFLLSTLSILLIQALPYRW